MKLFIGNIDTISKSVILKEEEEHHIVKVLRMNSGEIIYITDGKGNLAKGKLNISGKKALIETLEIFPITSPPSKKLHIALAPTKTIERFEFFIEKSVELGIYEITPLLCSNSERKIIKIDKIQKQIESACKQSLRVNFPILNPLTSLSEFIKKEKTNIFVSHCYKEYEKIPLNKIFIKNEKINMLIGPEGDFSKKEIEALYEFGATGIDLGKNRLRTETAGIFVASAYWYNQSF